ncbi:MAG: LysM peptidoglycan-binding domain-containing protein [Candidatus Gastranaerophilales bacterium]|nr:LysM peptidoglycan-binding domain-containing protein [Candidatus Gastranaerophilales bacterium]MCM1073341.1 LysM peptidoglycan-binding domain-containing protein [Bacteroides sp.]
MGKDIRNYEFKVNNGQVYFNDKGDIKFKGKGKKELKQLQPLFDAIMKADDSYKSNDKKLDSAKEKDLMDKLHKLLMADGIVDANELKLGDEFTRSGLTAEAFINTKFDEANKKAESKDYAALDAAVEQAIDNEPVDTIIRQRTWADDPTLIDNNPTVAADDTPVETTEDKKTPERPDPRVSANAFNTSIQNEASRLAGKREELETEFTNTQTIKKGSTLYKIAVDALIDEGIENPTPRQINTRIAEIAMLNNITNVNNVRVGQELKVGRGNAPDAGADPSATVKPTANSPASAADATVAPSSITVADKTPEKTLEDLEYSPEEKTVEAEGEEEGFTYKEWTKEGSVPMYTTEVDGVTLAAESLDKLKEIRTEYKNAAVKGTPEEEETDEAKAARQTENLANMKKQIELSGGNIDVIKNVIAQLRGDGNVELESAEVQAFVQDLVRTKNIEVLQELLFTTDAEGDVRFDLIKNEESAKTVASLYKEIRAKENAGEKLTDEEIALKEFYKDSINPFVVYSIAADEANGVIEKTMVMNETVGDINYNISIDGVEYVALDSTILDAFAKDLSEADTDEKKSAVFKKYAQTDDKAFAASLAASADRLKASKEDVEALIAKNDMYVLKDLDYTPVSVIEGDELEGFTATDKTDGEGDDAFAYKEYTKTEGDVTTTVYTATVDNKEIKANSLEELKQAVADYKEFNNKVAARVETIYIEAAGDPANMRYLEEAFAKIDATDKTDVEKEDLKNKILETYFDVTTTTEGEGEDAATTKSYTFKPSRRPTYEEISKLYNYTDNSHDEAIINSITLDDMGQGQWASFMELQKGCCERYAELINDMDEAGVLDFIRNKMVNAKGRNLPFDKVMEMFPDSADLKAELLKYLDNNSTCSDANRVAILQTVLSEDRKSIDAAKLPDGVGVQDLVVKLPDKCDGEGVPEGATEVFNAILTGLGKNDLDNISNMAGRIDNKDKVKEKLTEIISTCTAADVDYLVGMADKFKNSVNVDAEIQAKLGELLNATPKDKELVVKIAKLTNSSLVPYDTLREIDAQAAEWDDDTKAAVFESTINGFYANDSANLLAKAVEKHLVTKLEGDRYQLGSTVYLTDWGRGEGDERTIVMKKVSATGYERGQKMFKEVDGIGSGDIYDMIKGNGNYANYMTTDSISGILQAFQDKSPKEGLMQFLHNETTDYSAGFCSRVPKMLMRRAQELGLQNTESYQKLAEYYGAQGESKCANGVPTEGDTFKFTQNDANNKELSEEQAKTLDSMIYALLNDVLKKS